MELQLRFATALSFRDDREFPVSLQSSGDREPCAVEPVASAHAWQGWSMRRTAFDWREKTYKRGDVLYLDFGRHGVGTATLEIEPNGDWSYDAPLRLRLVFGELPAEVAEADLPYQGGLSQSWIQEEIINLDLLPCRLTLPRRYAFRYLRIECLAFSGAFRFRNVAARTASSGDYAVVPPLPAGVDAELAAIDRVGLATMHSCMQRVLEDGPKRDRRLWLGDLKLQALVNGVSFRNFALIERCLYLLATALDDDGLIPGCVFDRPTATRGCDAVDYALLFGATLLDHLEMSGNRDFVEGFFDLALHQLDLVRDTFGPDRRLPEKPRWWVFIDHVNTLNRDAAYHATYIYSLRQNAELARRLNRNTTALELELEAERRSREARSFFYDENSGLVYSGANRQLSFASQIWFVLAGILTPEESVAALTRIEERTDAIRPVSPYLWHYMVEALFVCGRDDRAWQVIRSYWGDMVRHGADTFWEVYVPEQMKFSPYGDFRLNSACHAWSCTPSYFIRRYAR